jgi:itaconate CoA-transferase
MRPLDGITVVAVEQAVAAPFATRQLADLGARVIKVERVDGGDFARGYDHAVHGMSSYFLWLNRSKESIALDFKTPEGAEVLARLVSRADVFVQNLAPGAAARLGFDAAALTARHERLIAVDLSGYGAAGPNRDKKAYDLLVQAEAGLVSVTGTPEVGTKTGIPSADIAGGTYAASAVLAALFRRERTGRGAVIELSLFDGLIEWMGHPLYLGMYTGTQPPRRRLGHTVVAPYDAFPAKDGGEVLIGVQNDREWQRFATQVLGQPELVEDPAFSTNVARVRNREAVNALVGAFTASLTVPELNERLDAAGIANARMNAVPDVVEHPQLAARQRWCPVDSPVGTVRAVLPPIIMDDCEIRMDPIPALGEHTDRILAELGYDALTVDRLHVAGVVGRSEGRAGEP